MIKRAIVQFFQHTVILKASTNLILMRKDFSFKIGLYKILKEKSFLIEN